MANKQQKYVILPVMARRPDPAEFDRALTPVELSERHRRLSMLSPQHVADAYRRAHEACRVAGDRLPKAADVQEIEEVQNASSKGNLHLQ